MGVAKARLTVLFEDPFWVMLYEREDDGAYSVCKIPFGSEPRDGEIYAYLLANWNRLRFSPALEAAVIKQSSGSPKRRQRDAQKLTQKGGIGTKAQQALQLQREQIKQARQDRTHTQREAEEARKFQLRQKKRMEKHRGH